MNRFLKILKISLFSIVVLFLLVNIWTLFARNVLKQDLPSVFGVSGAVVASGSMEPEFCKNDFILVKEKETYQVGDIITFKDGNGFTTHRIVAIEDGLFVTKGDANNAVDPLKVESSNVIGRVVSVWHGFGGFILFMHSVWGILLIFMVGLIAILIEPFSAYLKALKREVSNETKV